MKYAHIDNNVIQQIVIVPDGFSIADMFHPSIVNMFVPVPDHVDVCWSINGDEWAAPQSDE